MPFTPLIVDAHQDLAWNIMTFGRDYRRSALETRWLEQNTIAPEQNGDCLLGWPEYQQGRVALIFATLFAAPARTRMGKWDQVCYNTPDEAHNLYMKQVDIYRRMSEEQPDYFRLVRSKKALQQVLEPWQAGKSDNPVGLVMLMECADGVRSPGELEEWWQAGVRLIGPAWAGTRYCGGTREPGPLTAAGFALLDGMAELGFGLDLSHMDAQAAMQALDHYPGRILASHSNALRLVKGSDSNRHLPDEVLHGLLARDGVIGLVPLNGFLLEGWRRGQDRSQAPLSLIVAQMDYICQLAGDARHVAFGTDFDGGFGLQSVPQGLDTIADLPLLIPLLEAKGYQQADIEAIFGGNWLRFIDSVLPEADDHV